MNTVLFLLILFFTPLVLGFALGVKYQQHLINKSLKKQLSTNGKVNYKDIMKS